MGADAEKYAQWIVDNKDKKGTPDFEKVSKAYQVAKTQSVPKPSIWDDTPLSDENINNLYEGFGGSALNLVNNVRGGLEYLTGNDRGLASQVTGKSNREMRQERYKKEALARGADPESMAYLGGKITGDIGIGSGALNALGKVAGAIPQTAKYADLLSSGGFKLGNAETASKLANALLRSGTGAVTGGAVGTLISPEDAGTSAIFGALAPPGFDLVSKALGQGANKLMTSALKPSKKQLESGEGARAAKTMLEEGVNPTLQRTIFGRGIDTLEGKISSLNNQISSIIQNSNGTVSKSSVISYLDDLLDKAKYSLAPESDMAAVQSVKDQFIAHPLATSENIPVQLAQKLKQGTYKSIGSKNFNELGGSTKEALRAGSKGLKEGVAAAEPSVSALNAKEGDLINALDIAESRAYQALKNNPAGLAGLAQNPTQFALMLADRSDAFKALMARMMYQTGKVVNQSSKMPIGVAPAVAASQGEQ